MFCLKACLVVVIVTIVTVCRAEDKVVFYFPKVLEWMNRHVQSQTNLTDTDQKQGSSISECNVGVSPIVRTIDGRCNNPQNLGSSYKPYSTLLPPAYDDGFNSMRQNGIDGSQLPSARLITRTVHPSDNAFVNLPFIVVEWGQLTAHDIISTASTELKGSCCGPKGEPPSADIDPSCVPIELPADETDFSGVCMNFVRSLGAEGTPEKPRQQINIVTSFLDGSEIYGSTEEQLKMVRVADSYLLRTKYDNLLPESTSSSCKKRGGTRDYCFLGGDPRVNQHPYLSALSTIWVREHNRVAKKLRLLKFWASTDQIFQLTRKIIIGMVQVITYNEYLPVILGKEADVWGLTSRSGRSSYQSIDPSVHIPFNSAAFRFGHSTVPSLVSIGNRKTNMVNLYNRPGDVIDNIDDVLAGLVGVEPAEELSIQAVDRCFVEDISKNLFLDNTTGTHSDLVSTNIQRGRDHGVQPYVKWRAFCDLRPLTGFNDTEALGPFVSKLAQVYKSVEDIDLYTGMLHEPVLEGLVGPTVSCILRNQFFRTKFGDRYFFDTNNTSYGFTDGQLEALRGVTLSKVLCHNSNLKKLPRDAFHFPSRTNPLVPCRNLKTEDLNFFLFI